MPRYKELNIKLISPIEIPKFKELLKGTYEQTLLLAEYTINPTPSLKKGLERLRFTPSGLIRSGIAAGLLSSFGIYTKPNPFTGVRGKIEIKKKDAKIFINKLENLLANLSVKPMFKEMFSKKLPAFKYQLKF